MKVLIVQPEKRRSHLTYTAFSFLRRYIAAAVLLVAASLPAVVVEWDANPEPEVIGYRVFFGPASRSYTNVTTVTNTLLRIDRLPLGTNFFAVTAFAADGLESDYSDEVAWLQRPGAPTRLRLSSRIVVEHSANLLDWQPVATNDFDAALAASFYRSRE